MVVGKKKDANAKAAKEERKNKPFYGDLVCAAAFTAVTPVDGKKALQTCLDEPGICHVALLSVTFCAIYGALNWVAYLKDSNVASFAAFLAGLWLCAFNNIHGWPYPEECVIVPQFLGILAGTLSNGSLTLENKLVRFALMFGVASYVSIQSPHSIYEEDVLPLLGGPILLSIVGLTWNPKSFLEMKQTVNWNAWTVQGARYLLAAIFMHHTAKELLAMTSGDALPVEPVTATAMDTLWAVVKASFVALVGVAATGTFQKEIDLNEKLEVLVKERTREIQEKNDKLHMVELALRASETAIAITDSDLNLIWLNAACEAIAATNSNTPGSPSSPGQDQDTHQSELLGQPLVDVLKFETIRDETKLTKAFSKSRQEDEICIGEVIYHLEVSPYEYSVPEATPSDSDSDSSSGSNTSGRYMVVLKNITAERAREVAEKVAREEAMLAKAMGDSMVTLTVSYRSELELSLSPQCRL